MVTNSLKILSISFFVAYSSGLLAQSKPTDSKNVVSPTLTAQIGSQEYDLDQSCPQYYTANAGNASCVGDNCGSITVTTSHNGGFKNKATYHLTNLADQPKTFQLSYQCYAES